LRQIKAASHPPRTLRAMSATLADARLDHAGLRVAEASLRIGGMFCAACAGTVEHALRSVDGVLEAHVSVAAERATVRWNPQRTGVPALIAALRRAGYDAAPDATAAARRLRRDEHRLALWRLFVAGFCAMQVMMLAAPGYLAAPGEIAPDLLHLLHWGEWLLSVPVLLFSATPFWAGAWRALRERRIGMDVPVALGIAVTFVAGSAVMVDPGGPFGDALYFDSLTMFISFLLLGRSIELRLRHQAAAALEGVLGAMPETALRLNAEGLAERVSIGRLVAGDRLRVPAGDAFAADGVVIEGCGEADEALLTGESRPVHKQLGDAVIAGSVNLVSPLVIRVERVGADTRYEAIVGLMRDALGSRPAAARWADRWAAPFLWTVLVLAAGAAAVWAVIEPARAVWVAVSVLIVTCPCALSLATPAALLSASGALARRGVLLRRIDALETLARVNRIFIDKTGTLTTERPGLASVEVVGTGDRVDADDLLQGAASLAAWSRHPLSAALCAAVPERPVPRWHALHEQAGAGVEALDGEGQRWRLGSAAWVGAEARDDAAGLTVWFGPHGKPLLRLSFEETLRPDAEAAIAALRRSGIAVQLLSGDAAPRVARLAQRLGLEAAVGAADPRDKLRTVQAAQAAGEVVAMVGDGINDAPVLAQADVSLAMGEGALLARANADAVIASNRLGDVVAARELAQRTLGVIRQNIAWAAGYNALCVPLALAGLLPPWLAGLGMALSSLVVVLNAARLRR
jgi:Cu2+-exporting ATPase